MYKSDRSSRKALPAGRLPRVAAGMPDFQFKHLDVGAAMQRLDGDRQFFADMAEMFLRFKDEYLSHLGIALDNADVPQVGRRAHGLKGALSEFTFKAPCRTAQALEEMAAAGNLSQAAPLFAELQLLVEQLCGELEQYVAAVSGGLREGS